MAAIMQQRFSFNKRIYKKLLKQKRKEEIKTGNGLTKFCNALYWILILGTGISAIATIYYLSAVSEHPAIELALLIMTVGFPYGLSFMPKTVVDMVTLKDFRFRTRNSLSIEDDCLRYGYTDKQIPVREIGYLFEVKLNDISEIDYYSKSGTIVIKGKIKQYYIFDGETNDVDCYEFCFLNAYDVDILEVLKKTVDLSCKVNSL